MPTIRSDNGLVFTANRFRAACRDYRLTQEFITPYALQQNDRTFLPQPQGGVRLATRLRLVRRGQGCDRELDPLLQRASSPPGARLPEPSPVPGSTTTGGGLRCIAMCRAMWLQKGCREAAGEAWYGASEPVTHRHPCSQRAGSAYGIRTRVTAVRGRPEGLSDRDLSLIHISEPTRLGMISSAVFCLKTKTTGLELVATQSKILRRHLKFIAAITTS